MKHLFQIHPTGITIRSLLHQATNSDVYSGLYKNNKLVAVKILKGSALNDQERNAFITQVKILKRVNHVHIVQFLGYSVKEKSTMMLVFELIENSEDVERYIKSDHLNHLEVVWIIWLALAIAKAMEYLHSQGILHTNLKLSNLLMTKYIVMITGFGNAIEEKVDEKDVEGSHKLEIFSFGELLHELLQCYTNVQSRNLYLRSTQGELPRMDEIPESLVQLMKACISKEKERRPAGFSVIREELEDILRITNQLTKPDLVYGQVIANSSSAVIYNATYNSRPIVVKVYADSKSDDELIRRQQKYDRQIAVFRRVQHPNIIEYVGAIREPGPRIFTEHMFGGTLQNLLLRIKPDILDIKNTIRFALEISEAMEHLHSHGITHRNLKSCHIFLKGDMCSLKLGGFGQAMEEKNDDTALANVKADVYDFSKILWELLTNNHTEFQSFASSIEEKRPSLVQVPDMLVELLECCASEKAEERPEFKQITAVLQELHDEIVLPNLRDKRGRDLDDEEGGDGNKKIKLNPDADADQDEYADEDEDEDADEDTDADADDDADADEDDDDDGADTADGADADADDGADADAGANADADADDGADADDVADAVEDAHSEVD